MFENNLDLDLDENLFSDDFLPSDDKVPKAPCDQHKETNASNFFKQPSSPGRVQRVLSSINTRHKNEKRVALRKFPGPAGLLPEISSTHNSFREPNDANNEIDDVCSQASLSMFQEDLWKMMRRDFKAESNYTIEWIKSNATGKTLVNQKAPFLAAIIKSIECTTKLKMPTFTLKDPTDEIQADISHDLYDEHVSDLTVGSVIVLRQFSVFSVKNETVHHLTITSNNLVAVYNKERRCRLDFENRKLGHDFPSSSTSSNVKKPSETCHLEQTRSCVPQNIHSVADVQSVCPSNLELIQKIQAIPDSKNSFSPLKGTSAKRFKFCANTSLKMNYADDLNLSLDLSSDEFSPSKKTGSTLGELKSEVCLNTLENKSDANEESPPLKKPKTTLSQKFQDFKYRPRDDLETAQKDGLSGKSKGNFIDCSQISIVSQNKEDEDILQDVFHNVDAESLFEEF